MYLLDCHVAVLAVLDRGELEEAEGRGGGSGRGRSRRGAAQAGCATSGSSGRGLSDGVLRDGRGTRSGGSERQKDHWALAVHVADVAGVEGDGRHCVGCVVVKKMR